MRSATTSLPGHPPSVPQARRWAVTTVTSWGLEVTAGTVAQVVSELATNCTLHARSDFSVRLAVTGGGVRVEATDGTPGGLQLRQYTSTATTGRGLRIVDSLSSSWGVVPAGDGKTVWVLLPLEDPLLDDDGGDEDRPGARSGASVAGPAPTGPLVRAAA